MVNKKKKVLISGYIGFQNFGDDVLLAVLTKHLKEKNCEITAFSSNPQDTMENFSIKAVPYKNIFAILKEILNSLQKQCVTNFYTLLLLAMIFCKN